MLNRYIAYVVIALLLITGLIYWINWSADMVKEVADLNNAIESLEKDKASLKEVIVHTSTRREEVRVEFKEITEDQIGLICAARYTQPLAPEKPNTPTIVEVVKWRDKVTKCPTTDPNQAEEVPIGAVMRPVNDEIRVRSLNNAWKAFCISTKSQEEVCAPFN